MKYAFIAVFLVSGAIWANSDSPEYERCLQTVFVDLLPLDGETWAEHSARMDAAADRVCRRWHG